MKSSLLKVLALCSVAIMAVQSLADATFSADQSFGAEMPAGVETVSLKQAINSLNGSPDQFFKIQGQITEVCQAKGCWMILMDGDSYARVRFENYGFFVPTETSMQRSIVYGVLTEHVLSGEEADHYAQDAGAQSTLQLKGEVREYSIMARAVQLENRS